MNDSSDRDSHLDEELAIIVTRADGTIVESNEKAQKIIGEDSVGKLGWDAFNAVPESKGLPCHQGCVCRIVAQGPHRIHAKDAVLGGKKVQMRCVPVQGHVVTTIAPRETKKKVVPKVKLTRRELDVLALLVEGLTTPAVAKRIGVSASTVRTHVEHMRQKLGVNTRAALVANALSQGYLAEDDED